MTTRPHLSIVAVVALAHAALAWVLLQSPPSYAPVQALPTLTWVRVLMQPTPAAVEPQNEARSEPRPEPRPEPPHLAQAAPRKPVAAVQPHRSAAATSAAPAVVASAHDSPAQAPAAPAAPPAPPAEFAMAAPSAPPPSAAAEPMQQAEHAHCPRAPHPPVLRERGIEGRVVLRVRVDAQGRAGDAQVVHGGSGWRLFDAAALTSALDCRFVPARRDGEPVDSWVEFTVRFALRD
jgi:periplasmic protein TonB